MGIVEELVKIHQGILNLIKSGSKRCLTREEKIIIEGIIQLARELIKR